MDELLLFASLFGMSIASGLIPIINAELLVLGGVVAVDTPAMVVLVVVVASLGQMVAKVAMFAGAGQATRFLGPSKMAKLETYKAKVEAHPNIVFLVFISSLIGLPPLYVISILAGALDMVLWQFFVAGLLGRLLRFGVLAGIPSFFDGLW